MGRIDNNCWCMVSTYNANKNGIKFNHEFSTWINENLTIKEHFCFNNLKIKIHIPRKIIKSKTLFGVDVGIDEFQMPLRLFNEKCIFCINLNQENLDDDLPANEEEKTIINVFDSLKKKNNSTVPTTKTLFAWWPDLFIPLDRTHNYNNIAFEFQTYKIKLPINRSNEIQNIDGIKYIKILRSIQFQLIKWIKKYGKNQNNLREIDTSMIDSPFLRVIDKNYW